MRGGERVVGGVEAEQRDPNIAHLPVDTRVRVVLTVCRVPELFTREAVIELADRPALKRHKDVTLIVRACVTSLQRVRHICFTARTRTLVRFAARARKRLVRKTVRARSSHQVHSACTTRWVSLRMRCVVSGWQRTPVHPRFTMRMHHVRFTSCTHSAHARRDRGALQVATNFTTR